MDWTTILMLSAALATPLGTLAGVTYGLNGLRERAKNIDTKLDAHIIRSTNQHTEVVQRLTKVETQLENNNAR